MSRVTASRGHSGPLRALRHYNFRVFWCGQILSLVGSWMQGIAQSWLILTLADPSASEHPVIQGSRFVSDAGASAAVQAVANRYQGDFNFWQGLPILLFTIFAGVVIDRVNKRKLLVVTQVGFMLCALSMGLLIRSGLVQINYVIMIGFMVGLFLAFDMPTRQSFVVEIVGKQDVASAVALNSSQFNAARAIGPSVAGLLLAAHVSLAACFFLNAASYILVIAGILLMRGQTLGDPVPHPSGSHEEMRVLDNLKAGIAYVRQNHTIFNIVMLVGGMGTFAFSFNVLIPTLVRYTLLAHADSAVQVKAFGFLESVRGVGALCAAITVVLFSKPKYYKRFLIGGGLLSNALLMVFSFERSMTAAYVTMAVVTFGFVLIFASANTVMQMVVPDNLRGRVMAIYTLVFIGTGPIGSGLAGILAQHIGAPHTVFAFAVLTFLIVAVVSFRPGGLRALKIGGIMTETGSTLAGATSASLAASGQSKPSEAAS